MSTQTIILNPYQADDVNHTSPFNLLPTDLIPPFIVKQPITNIKQTTWLASNNTTEVGTTEARAEIKYQQIKPKQNIVNVLQGTVIEFGIDIVDNSLPSNPNIPNVISYVWKKDGAPISQLNNLNSRRGTSSVKLTSDIQTTGEYLCEVSNLYGTTTSAPFKINAIDPYEHPKLYKNLITNGSGERGLTGWTTDRDIKTLPFHTPKFDKNIEPQFSSFRIGGITADEYGGILPEFRFSIGNHYGMFHRLYTKRKAVANVLNEAFGEPYIKGISAGNALDGHERWYSEGGSIPQIIPNEDYDLNNHNTTAGFFPGLAWMDKYNKNDTYKIVGLTQEYSDAPSPFYFTRDKIKFINKGGKAETSLTQTVDLTDIADIIDGNAYGITHATGQFFAYVGAGITDYKIKFQEESKTEPTTTNYYVADYEDYKYEFQEAWRSDPSLDFNVYYGLKEIDATGSYVFNTKDTSINGTGSMYSQVLASISPSNLYSQVNADAQITKLNEIIQYYYMRFLDKDRSILHKFSNFSTNRISVTPVPVYYWYWYSGLNSAEWKQSYTLYPNKADSNAPLPFKAEYTTSSLDYYLLPGTAANIGTYNYEIQFPDDGLDFRALYRYYGDIQIPSATNIMTNLFNGYLGSLTERQETLRTIGRFIADDLHQPWYMLRRIFDEAKDYLQRSDIQAILGADFANELVSVGNYVRNNTDNQYARKKDIIKTSYKDGKWENWYHINNNGSSDAETHARDVIVPKMYEMFNLLHDRYIAISRARDLLAQEIVKVQWVRSVESAYYRAAQEKKQYRIKRFTDIEIQPKVYDKTRIELTYYNAQNVAIKTETINGPN